MTKLISQSMDTTNLELFGQKSNLTYGPIIGGQYIILLPIKKPPLSKTPETLYPV
jgi:hypothetical protein